MSIPMRSTSGAAGPRVLDPSQCWSLLRTRDVGRVAFVLGGRLELLPVNYAVDGGSVVFRTSTGAKLEAADLRTEAVFEVDAREADETAWSVVLRGTLRRVRALHELVGSYTLPIYPWEASPKNAILRLHGREVTGPAFAITDPSAWRDVRPSGGRAADE